MPPAIIPHDFVVNRVKSDEVGEHRAGEPGERLGAAQAADGKLEVMTPPAPLDGAAGRRQALAEQRRARRVPQRLAPERAQQRLPRPGPRLAGYALGQAGEQTLVVNAP